jgi:predicted ATPase
MQKITFENYKAFKNKQELELKPITILLGKNSSGKSAITKLPSMIENSLKGEFPEPLQFVNDDVELGAEFRDLMHGRKTTGANALKIGLYDGVNESLEVSIVQTDQSKDQFGVFTWKHVVAGKEYIGNDSNEFRGFKRTDSGYNGELSLKLNVHYIGPFRKLPERSYSRNLLNVNGKFGIHGENAYPILIQKSQEDSSELVENVSKWYAKHFDGWKVFINASKSPFYQVELGRQETSTCVNIKDVGQGMSQALPIVTRAFLPTEEETLIILEQPELHLHPAAHGDLGELFVTSVLADSNKKYLIETHSQNLILRMRSLVASGVLPPESMKIYFVDFDEEAGVSELRPIDVDAKGNVSFWPDNIFNESYVEAKKLAKAQRGN